MSARVLLVVDELGLSGKTKALVDLATGLDPRRFTPSVLSFSRETGPLGERLRQSAVPLFEESIPDGLGVRALLRVASVVRRLRPDVVHCYNPRAMLYGGVAARLLKIRATLGTLSAFACMVPDRPYQFLPQRLLTRSPRNRLRNRLVAGLMQRLAVPSPELGARFCAYNRIPLSRMRVVPYGVPLGEPPQSPQREQNRRRLREQLGLSATAVVVASIGRLVDQKDYPTQLRGFAAAAREEPRLLMLLVGEGPLRQRLTELAAELGIAARVVFLGYRSDVRQLLQAADIFTLTSIFEPYGVAVLEAKANGTPILAAAVDEIPRLLAHGRSGQLFQPASAESYARELLAMVRDPQPSMQAAWRAFEESQEQHGLAAMIGAYEGLYDEIRTTARH